MTINATAHYNNALYIINTDPKEDDIDIILDSGGRHYLDIGNIFYHVDSDNPLNDKVFFYTGNRFVTNDSGKRVEKAIYREMSDARHIQDLQDKITALQTRLETLESPIVTEGTLTANIENITGNNTEYNIAFSDKANASLWTAGKITLKQGLYYFSLVLHLADVPLATNHVYVAVKIQPNDSTKPLETFPYRIDADRLVRGESGLNVDTKTSYFRVSESSDVYFTIRVDGGGTDTIDLNSGTRVIIERKL